MSETTTEAAPETGTDRELSVSEKRREEAQAEWGPDALSVERQKAENAKIKIGEGVEKGGFARGATGALINEGGSGADGGVV